jgi:hypothetical protein
MRLFKDLLAEKCSDPAFVETYLANCSVCETTVAIGAALYAKGLSYEDAAKQTGVPVRQIVDLVDADLCAPAVVRKLCAVLDIPIPECSEEKQDN